MADVDADVAALEDANSLALVMYIRTLASSLDGRIQEAGLPLPSCEVRVGSRFALYIGTLVRRFE